MSSSDVSAAAELRVICGPTAAGKSGLAMRLAERHGLAVINADSRQIYRGFDIGTAKPSPAQRAAVPHHGVDVADPGERWSASRWALDAGQWIAAIGAGRALVVGGTGLYLRALVTPFFEAPALDPVKRAALAAELDALTTDELRERVTKLDPRRAHLGRAQLLRAAEVVLLTGQRISEMHNTAARPRAFRARWLVVDPLEGLQSRIGTRLDAMFAAGWVDEVQGIQRTVSDEAPAWQACGYRTVRALARGECDETAVREDILIATRQYAKRQRTWFRHQLTDGGEEVTSLDPRDPHSDAMVEEWWSSGDPA
jgi:tRNA dimethylallyltransferase